MSRPPCEDAEQAAEALERAERLRAMGGVLREASGDETDDGWGEAPPTPADSGTEADLRREVPPHHGS